MLRTEEDVTKQDNLCLLSRYAFGDSRKPSTQSATLIEEIVHSQMASLVWSWFYRYACLYLNWRDDLLAVQNFWVFSDI